MVSRKAIRYSRSDKPWELARMSLQPSRGGARIARKCKPAAHRWRRRGIHVALSEIRKSGCTCANLDDDQNCLCETLSICERWDYEATDYLAARGEDLLYFRRYFEKDQAAWRNLRVHQARGTWMAQLAALRSQPGIPGLHIRAHLPEDSQNISLRSCTTDRLQREFRVRGVEPLLSGAPMLRALAELAYDRGTCSILMDWSRRVTYECYFVNGGLRGFPIISFDGSPEWMRIDGRWEVYGTDEEVEFIWHITEESGGGYALIYQPSSGIFSTWMDGTLFGTKHRHWVMEHDPKTGPLIVTAHPNQSLASPEPWVIHVDGAFVVSEFLVTGHWMRPLHSLDDAADWARTMNCACDKFGYANFFESSYGRHIMFELLEAVAPRPERRI